jgi:hypothetical protein
MTLTSCLQRKVDYVPRDSCGLEKWELLLIVAIDPFRFFHCKEGTKKYVDVNAGECVMFSGKCAHGSAATNYPEKTYRLFVCFAQI